MSTPFYAVLGSHPALSELEIESLLPSTPVHVAEKVIGLSSLGTYSIQELQDLLGGTIKLLESVARYPVTAETNADIDYNELVELSVKTLQELAEDSQEINFSVLSLIDGNAINNTHVKKGLQAQGFKVRFREGKRPYGLSAAILLDNPVTELFVFVQDDEIVFAKTQTCQDINVWTFRDRGRPFADRKRGMLPLKVARMLLNIATKGNYSDHHVYDPFCGTGSILQEAMQLGIAATGSDISYIATKGTLDNLEWYADSALPEDADTTIPHIFTGDVTQVSAKHFKQIPTAIVTEPFLGKQQAPYSELPNIYKGLYKLYKGAFNAWKSFLPKDATIVIVFPSVQTGRTEYSLTNLIDELPDLGYNIVSGPITYARPDAHTKRQVYIIRKQA